MNNLLTSPDQKIRLDAEVFALVNEADRSLYQLDGAISVLPASSQVGAALELLEAAQSVGIDYPGISIREIYKQLLDEGAGGVNIIYNYLDSVSLGRKLLRNVSSPSHIIKSVHAELYKNLDPPIDRAGEFRKNFTPADKKENLRSGENHDFPAPDEIPILMDELHNFIALNISYPALINAALIHAQIELIHPFDQGNGMAARILTHLHLLWKKKLSMPVLQLSGRFGKKKIEFSDRLIELRLNKNTESWIKFYLKNTISAALETSAIIKNLLNLRERNYKSIIDGGLASAPALRFFELLPKRPVVSLSFVTRELDLNKQTANIIISNFLEAGILEEITGQKRNRLFAYTDYLNILEPQE
jgi:Fic family protein